jgi:HK97 family phage portal protein
VGGGQLISEQIGQLPLKVYRRFDDTEGESERVEARQHRSWRMLHDKPNSHTPADRFWAAVTSQLLLYGNAFIRKSRDETGVVDELFLLNPEAVTVEYDPPRRRSGFCTSLASSGSRSDASRRRGVARLP